MLPYTLVKASHKVAPKELEKLEKLCRKVIKIKRKLLLGSSTLAPVNYKEERDKFLSSKKYNPKFIYKKKKLPKLSKEIDSYKIETDKLNIPEDLKEHVLDFLDDQIDLYNVKNSIGTGNFSDHAHKLFDWGTDRLDMILTNTPAVEFRIDFDHVLEDANRIKERFESVLKKYDIHDFEVKIDKLSPHLISVGYRTISVGNGIKRYACNVDRLIIHEVESHVIQTYNMKQSITPISELFKYGNKHLYGEGLAIYNEIKTRKITPSAFETYYYRIKAVRNLHKSFREIYELLCEDIDPKKAYVMTYRVKRGMMDTSQPGGFPKDASYLLGYHEIENLYAENYSEKLMYATKSPILSTLLHNYGLIEMDKILIPKFEG